MYVYWLESTYICWANGAPRRMISLFVHYFYFIMKETKILLPKILRIIKLNILKVQGNTLPLPLFAWCQDINPSLLEIGPEKASASPRRIWEQVLLSFHIFSVFKRLELLPPLLCLCAKIYCFLLKCYLRKIPHLLCPEREIHLNWGLLLCDGYNIHQ